MYNYSDETQERLLNQLYFFVKKWISAILPVTYVMLVSFLGLVAIPLITMDTNTNNWGMVLYFIPNVPFAVLTLLSYGSVDEDNKILEKRFSGNTSKTFFWGIITAIINGVGILKALHSIWQCWDLFNGFITLVLGTNWWPFSASSALCRGFVGNINQVYISASIIVCGLVCFGCAIYILVGLAAANKKAPAYFAQIGRMLAKGNKKLRDAEKRIYNYDVAQEYNSNSSRNVDEIAEIGDVDKTLAEVGSRLKMICGKNHMELGVGKGHKAFKEHHGLHNEKDFDDIDL
jgi:hypothetical protein